MKRHMRRFNILILSIITVLLITACTGNLRSRNDGDDNNRVGSVQDAVDKDGKTASIEGEGVKTPDDSDGIIESGTYTLPCGMKLDFFDSVRNDVTGNWRRAATSDSIAPADYALEYYQMMFSSDEEIHSVWNAAFGTTTRIMADYGLLYVDTLEYVKGEEHDAKMMFSGKKLDSKIIDIKTGEPVEG